MIEPNHELIRNQRRVMRTLYPMGDERKQMLRQRLVTDVFNQTYLYNHKDFWNTWSSEKINIHMRTIKLIAAQAGPQRLGEFLDKGFDELCTMPAADLKSMAMLCDFATAFDLELAGAPAVLPTTPTQVAS